MRLLVASLFGDAPKPFLIRVYPCSSVVNSFPRNRLCLPNHPGQTLRAGIGRVGFADAVQIRLQGARRDFSRVRAARQPFAEGGRGHRQAHGGAGFIECRRLRLIRQRPRLLDVLASGGDFVADAHRADRAASFGVDLDGIERIA